MSFLLSVIVIGFVIYISLRVRSAAKRRQRLTAKYGPEIAGRILSGTIWQGMTSEQLRDCLGEPTHKNNSVTKSKTKETWKYGQSGKNRFKTHIHIEDGSVVGWKD